MKTIILAAFVALAALPGCTKIKDLANINVDIPYSQQETIPQIRGYTQQIALPGGGLDLSLPAIPFATNSQQYISQYGTATDKVLDVDLKSLSLQILSPAEQNFDFIDNVAVYISSKTLPEMMVASEYNIPKGQTTLNLTTDPSVNLKQYFLQDTIYFRLQTHINATPFSGTQLNIASIFHMLANPLD